MKQIIDDNVIYEDINFSSLEKYRTQQIFPRMPYEEEQDLRNIWDDFENIKSHKDLHNWINNFRVFVWGDEEEFSLSNKDDMYYYQERIDKFMGEAIFDLLSKNSCFERLKNMTKNEEDLDSIIEKIENDEKIRGLFLGNHKVPDDLCYKNILDFAETIGNKYNLKKIIISKNLCFEDIYMYLIDINKNLEVLAQSINIDTNLIGLNNLILKIELKKYSVNRYNSIHIGINNNNGFVMDWVKFFDHECALLVPNNANDFLSEVNTNNIPQENEELKSLLTSFNNRYKIKTDSYSILTMKKLLRKLPDIIYYIKKYTQSESEIDALNRVALIIDRFIAQYEFSIKENLTKNNNWQHCRKTCENILLKTGIVNNPIIFKFWLYAVSLTERISFNDEIIPNYKLWFILSVFIGRIEDNSKLTNKNEMLAVSLNTVVRAKLNKDTWLTNNNISTILTPQEEELEWETIWWKNNLKNILKMI